MSFWVGFIVGVCVLYILGRADFYVQLARGNIKLSRSYNKAELLIIGSVVNARERRERKKNKD